MKMDTSKINDNLNNFQTWNNIKDSFSSIDSKFKPFKQQKWNPYQKNVHFMSSDNQKNGQ